MISGLSGSGSSALLQQMRERMMSRLDSDGDGAISQAEFTAGRPKGASEADAASRFAAIDTDGDGSLTATEISSHFQQLASGTQGALLNVQGGGEAGGDGGGGGMGGCAGGGGRSRAAADALFSKLDSNGDGSVSKSELEQAFQGVAAANGTDATTATQQADDLFAKLDTDGNGSVSQSETEQAMRPHHHHHHGPPPSGSATSSDDLFKQLDANGDGVISKDEFSAATGRSSAQSGTQSGQSGAGSSGDAATNLLAALQGATGQQTANTVRAQMMDLLLKLQSTGATQAAA